jgi:hypothetical protein
MRPQIVHKAIEQNHFMNASSSEATQMTEKKLWSNLFEACVVLVFIL